MNLLKTNREMKIGVLTFCSTEDNYGQVLQCYALQFYLNSMGHETYLIKYDASRNGKDLLWLLSLPHKILRKVLSIVLNKKDDKFGKNLRNLKNLPVKRIENILDVFLNLKNNI